jgi:hypothetical protein
MIYSSNHRARMRKRVDPITRMARRISKRPKYGQEDNLFLSTITNRNGRVKTRREGFGLNLKKESVDSVRMPPKHVHDIIGNFTILLYSMKEIDYNKVG